MAKTNQVSEKARTERAAPVRLHGLVSWRLKYVRLINVKEIYRNDKCIGIGVDTWMEDEVLVRLMLWWWDICIRFYRKPANVPDQRPG
jgi:hypothetical protein